MAFLSHRSVIYARKLASGVQEMGAFDESCGVARDKRRARASCKSPIEFLTHGSANTSFVARRHLEISRLMLSLRLTTPREIRYPFYENMSGNVLSLMRDTQSRTIGASFLRRWEL